MDIQSFIFPKQYGLSNAKRWLDKHDAHTDVDVKANQYRFRQHDPSLYKPKSFRTMALDGHPLVRVVVGRRK